MMSTLPREQAVALLQRSHCLIPSIYLNWPGATPACNPNVDALADVVNEWLDDTLEPCKLREGLKKANFALFSAETNPSATFERARVMALWYVWLFVFDDAIDEPSATYGSDSDKLASFCTESKRWFQHTLGLLPEGESVTPPVDRRLRNFDVVGEALAKDWSVGQRQLYFQTLCDYVDGCAKENQVLQQNKDELPSVEEFWEIRRGSSGVFACAQLVQYSTGVELPDALWADPDLQKIVLNTVYDMSAVNEALSLRKELNGGGWLNLVVVLVNHGEAATLQEAIDRIASWLTDMSAEFELCAERLYQRWSSERGDHDTALGLRIFADGCRNLCVGSHAWSLETGRYGFVKGDRRAGGALSLDMTRGEATRPRLDVTRTDSTGPRAVAV